MSTQVQQLDRVVIRIAGDSGDGMQLTGDRFTQETANCGNDLSSQPNFLAETKANLPDLAKGATIIVDTKDFTARPLARVGWTSNPIEDGTLDSFTVHALDLTQLTLDSLAALPDLSRKDAG